MWFYFISFAEIKDELPCLEASMLAYSSHENKTGETVTFLQLPVLHP
jgi:hypothetical protein